MDERSGTGFVGRSGLAAFVAVVFMVASPSAEAQEVDLFEGDTMAERDLRRSTAVSPFDSRIRAALHGGIINYDSLAGETQRKGAFGLLLNWNLAQSPQPTSLTTSLRRNVEYGIQTGAVFSPLGSTGGAGAADGDLYLVPANAYAGYLFSERLIGSLHGGMNLAYRTSQAALNFGEAGGANSENDFSIHPNIGVELGWGISERLALMLRGDLMFTDGTDPFLGTLGLGFSL